MPTATTVTRPLLRRWRPRPQFSLRMLLLAITAFAIGFPIWYRWPIEEVEVKYPHHKVTRGSMVIFEGEDKSSPTGRTVTTWRRSWGNSRGKVKHGPRREYFLFPPGYERLTVTNYENDQLHGPYRYNVKGELRESGQYEFGQKEGEWITVQRKPGLRAVINWHKGQRLGLVELHFPDGSVERLRLDSGLLTHVNDQPVSSPLFDRIRRGEITSQPVLDELQSEMWTVGSHKSLADWMGLTGDLINVPVLVTPAISDLTIPFDARELGLTAQSALVLITHRNGLACDYRYGCLWITTPEDAKDWRDPTGIAELRLKPGSPLAAAWNEPIEHWQFDEPLAKSLDKIFAPLGIAIDTTQIAPTSDDPDRLRINIYLSINGHYLSLQNLLGLLLYKTGCTCQLNGDTLVVLPPQDLTNNN